MPAYDADAVAALAEEQVTRQDRVLPPAFWGRTIAEVLADRPRLSQLPTPLMTLSAPGVRHNIETLARWCAQHGVEHAPHGKTTMAPALWAQQLDAGAWAITLANVFHLGIARQFGVRRVLIANAVVSPLQLRWVADELARDPEFEVMVWADSVRTVEIMEAARSAYVDADARPLDVMVELGGLGGRTGARDLETAEAIARAISESSTLRLVGLAGYEGAVGHGVEETGLAEVRAFLREMAALHERLRKLYDPGVVPIVTAGGSEYFELVAEVLGPLAPDARVVVRSGAYISHDDGLYRRVSPLGESPRTDGEQLVAAMHGWMRITSQPEPGLAIFDAGRRDFPVDQDMPEPQLIRPRSADAQVLPATGMTVTKLNDQHGYLQFGDAEVLIGDELRLGLSHPCTAFDKWGLIPLIDDPDAADPVVVDLIRTYF
ncbi:amino acid deaminase [Kribbella sandramycini]|uniref:Amino acid deaminase n=1 Tax=Kribbella sandramycini TaxID=60450 RepID=A0A7Y4P1S3_9ACTN|nr:alanine racemase [Kribbella sandramycini]MBB6564692.1 D-serine deaminase-like pyridoxal phosphate-dependent protein [Kribbella sandramycini]NOL42394.1 amino acid deaminase [Kribbella sandramycini]